MYENIGRYECCPITKGKKMFGNATIEVYDSEAAPVRSKDLSDELAMSFGSLFAQVLPDEQSRVIVTLASGEIKVMGLVPLPTQCVSDV